MEKLRETRRRSAAASGIICLKKETSQGKFREDLYYRLAVVPIHLPPLRERKEDVPLLIERFLERAAEKPGKKDLSLSPEALQIFLNHDWPGNVRELENAIEHAATLSETSKVGLEALPRSLVFASTPPGTDSWENISYREAKQKLIESFDKAYLMDLLKRSGGNITRAAEMADMDRKNLYEILKKHNITPKEESPAANVVL